MLKYCESADATSTATSTSLRINGQVRPRHHIDTAAKTSPLWSCSASAAEQSRPRTPARARPRLRESSRCCRSRFPVLPESAREPKPLGPPFLAASAACAYCPSTCRSRSMEIIPGARITTNRAGRTNNTIGKTIFTAALLMVASISSRRLVRSESA